MNTTTTWKMRLIESSFKRKIVVRVTVTGGAEYAVKDMKNLGHTVLFCLDRQAGYIAVDPEDIVTVWVPQLAALLSEAN